MEMLSKNLFVVKMKKFKQLSSIKQNNSLKYKFIEHIYTYLYCAFNTTNACMNYIYANIKL